MDIIKRAMLGDKKAQQEITARGELLPCPFRGGKDIDFGGLNGNDSYMVRNTVCGKQQ